MHGALRGRGCGRLVALAAICLLAAGCGGGPPLAAFQRAPPDDAWGCWVNAYGRAQYRPPVTTYTGPSHEARMTPGAKSLEVGDAARLRGYPAGGDGTPSLVLPGGTRVPDLDAIDFHARVQSFDVVCVDDGAAEPPGRE